MSCPHAKKQKHGSEKPYLVCLHQKTRIVKCYEEALCPLINMAGEEDYNDSESNVIEDQKSRVMQDELKF